MSIQNSDVTRRQVLATAGALGVGGFLAACAGPGSTARTGASGVSSAAAPKGAVSFAHWRGDDRVVFEELIKKFQAKYPDVTVSQDISTSADYVAQGLRRVRSGTVGDVAAAFRGDQFASFAKAQQFVPLDSSGLVSKFEPELISAGKSDGKQLGFPYQIVFNVPIANMDILSSVGYADVPVDWDSYLDMLDKIKAKGITPFVFPGSSSGDPGQLINAMSMNMGPTDDMFAKIQAGQYKCTDKWFIDMLYKYQELGKYAQPNSAGTSVEPAQKIFASGQGAILATGSYHIAPVRKLGAAFPIDLAPPVTSAPGQAKYVGIFNATLILGINTESKVQPAALAWLEFLSEPANASVYANGTTQHTSVKGVEYTNPDLKRLSASLKKKLLLAPRFQFTDLDMRSAVEAAGTNVLTGMKPEKDAEDAQLIVNQRIAAAK